MDRRGFLSTVVIVPLLCLLGKPVVRYMLLNTDEKVLLQVSHRGGVTTIEGEWFNQRGLCGSLKKAQERGLRLFVDGYGKEWRDQRVSWSGVS